MVSGNKKRLAEYLAVEEDKDVPPEKDKNKDGIDDDLQILHDCEDKPVAVKEELQLTVDKEEDGSCPKDSHSKNNHAGEAEGTCESDKYETLRESYGQWGIRWSEFDKNSRQVKREKFFDTKEQRDKFAEKLEDKYNFARFEAWLDEPTGEVKVTNPPSITYEPRKIGESMDLDMGTGRFNKRMKLTEQCGCGSDLGASMVNVVIPPPMNDMFVAPPTEDERNSMLWSFAKAVATHVSEMIANDAELKKVYGLEIPRKAAVMFDVVYNNILSNLEKA